MALRIYLAGPILREQRRFGLADWNVAPSDADHSFQQNGQRFLYAGPYLPFERDCDKATTVARDLSLIGSCDTLWGWVPNEGCHGTISEIGFATGRGKPAIVGFGNKRLARTHWFVAEMATTYGIFKTVTEFTAFAAAQMPAEPAVRRVSG